MSGEITKKRARLADVRPEEWRTLVLSAALFFTVLFSYYLIRGLRDELGVRQGVSNLPKLWIWTAGASFALHPVIGWAVAKLPRRTFIPLAFRGALVCVLATFFVLTRTAAPEGGVPGETWLLTARVFYVGVSVWAMLATSLFWSLMADVWRAEQGRRLFGLIATGGTLGGICGSFLLGVGSLLTDPLYALLLCAGVLELCAQLGRRVVRIADADTDADPLAAPPAEPDAEPHAKSRSDERIGGSIWAGLVEVASSPYLIGMAAFLLLVTLGNAFIYQHTSTIFDAQIADSGRRTSLFALMDVATNVLTLVGQGWLAAQVAKRFGAGLLLAGMPLVCLGGFAALAFWPIVPVVVVFNVLQRSGRYALTRPGRALLFTVVPRSERYKAQNFLDVVLYRVGDAGSAAVYEQALTWPVPGFAPGVPATAALIVPVCLATALAGFGLGRRFEARAARARE